MRLLGLGEAPACSLSTSAASFVKRPVFDGPMPPKRPASEFAIFVKTNMAALPAELNIREKMQRLGQMWKSCSETDKESYRVQCMKLKEEYEQKLGQFMDDLGPKKEEYVQQLSAYKHKKQDFRKAVRDKRKGIQGTNMSGYTLYLQDNFAASLDAHGGGRENVPIVMKELAGRWKELDENTKLGYKTRATTINSERKAKNETLVEKTVKVDSASKEKVSSKTSDTKKAASRKTKESSPTAKKAAVTDKHTK
ncbi:hypothetical protein EMCRGX_G006641 [Ephydatia muelleri]|eukprot:Em0002g1802a